MIDELVARLTLVGSVYGIRRVDSLEYRYVGITTKPIDVRLAQHVKNARLGTKTPLCDWLRKHGSDAIVVDLLDQVYTGPEDLGDLEIGWIRQLREGGHRLLNVSEGGLGPTGVVWTQEQREAARLRSTGRKGVSRPGELNPFHGRHHSPEQREQWARQRKGTNAGPANPNFGKFGPDHPSFGHVMSLESREALSKARRGEGNPNFGKVTSPETRAKQSAATKGIPRPKSARSAHTRYHTNKGRTSTACKYCVEDGAASSGTSEGTMLP
ncbi:hypothetical protein Bcav_0098 [Beutenbergia cavernae DSM 12333]|uniref:Nuclease associated modular domain-containing protein n=1 Tax=Beutenbergia cavernae (strain ATCC BAA-8 / DSM 12333 / CCUG 43141 / JCM 11478 / NBRC 16432 / NCIMB 13614 / HKI 0122) TaxID=471853 RepID=C5BUY9_BEUC1|nr:NUMOD3 domain-containing DNA-binding protein [Beutenbergia cavernae]ACQ78363.1 hypothetical protein Bcav_0098 [Beutenbergia cavernae DSM 12333]